MVKNEEVSIDGRGITKARRFRLQTLLVIVSVVAIVLGLITGELHREAQRKRTATYIRHRGGNVRPNRRPENQPTGITNGYLRVFLGDEYFTEIESIGLKSPTDSEFRSLDLFPELKKLSIFGAWAEGSRVRNLQLPQLCTLQLNCAITDDDFQVLTQSCRRLSSISVTAPISDAAVRSLANLPDLTNLIICSNNVTDSCIGSLPRKLLHLGFSSSQISASGIAKIAELPSLNSLCLGNLDVSAESIEHLSKMRALMVLQFSDSGIKEEQLVQLREKLPYCQISETQSQ